MNQPFVSLIMPTFNRENYIAESIEAIINQTYEYWECIIVDDGSTDNTDMLVKSFCERDLRINYFKRPSRIPKGANASRNYGFSLSKGELIMWVDSDDIMHPKCLELSVNYVTSEQVDFCRFSRSVFFGSNHDYEFSKPVVNNLRFLDKRNILDLLSNKIPFNTSTVIWQRYAIEGTGFNENIFFADEWEYYSRLLSTDIKGVSMDTVLFYGRKHKDSTTNEFWNFDKKRRASKVKACELVIENLKSKQLLNYQIAVHFISLARFLKEKKIYDTIILNSKHFTSFQRIKLKLRYHFDFFVKLLYRFKEKIMLLLLL